MAPPWHVRRSSVLITRRSTPLHCVQLIPSQAAILLLYYYIYYYK
jgi:hypothetical protein